MTAQFEEEARFISTVREKVEAMGGVFNGIRTIEIKIEDSQWMGSAFPHRLTFALVDF